MPISGAEDFAAFDSPGWVASRPTSACSRPRPAAGSETETRIQATDRGARRRFAVYWRIVGFGSALVRRDVLRATRQRAERSPGA